MEPVINNSPSSPAQELSLVENNTSEITLSEDQTNTIQEDDSSFDNADGNEDTNAQIVERLKEQRDQLRGIDELSQGEKAKRSKLKTLLILVLITVIAGSTYYFVVKPYLNKPDDSAATNTSQKNFALPSDLKSKTSEEKQALNIISLARQNKSDDIINSYLNKAHLGQSEADFKALVASYGSSADGEQVELVEKKVGKVDFASTGESSAIAETTAEFEAASLVYKSSYYRHTNNLYLKINLYKPDPTVDSWKMYVFEFKAGDASSPLKAEVNIAT